MVGGTTAFFRDCMKFTFGLVQSSRERTAFRRRSADFCHVPTMLTSWNTKTNETLSYSRELTG